MTRRKLIISLIVLIITFACWLVGKRWFFSKRESADLSYVRREKMAIAALAETILPRTIDSPGAKDAQVGEFIVDVVVHCLLDKEQNTFLRGLKRAQLYSQEQFGYSLSECDDDECFQVVRWMEQASKPWLDVPVVIKIRNKLFGRTFFQLVKTLTVEGYCTSEVGATQGLAFDAVPGSYVPCLTIHADHKTWALT